MTESERAIMTAPPYTAGAVQDTGPAVEWQLVPVSLDAYGSGALKAHMIGEFFEEIYFTDEEGTERTQRAPVSWTTIKAIRARMLAFYASHAAPPAPAASEVDVEEVREAVEALHSGLSEARRAIASLDADALGSDWAGDDLVPGGTYSWPLRDELLHNIDGTLERYAPALTWARRPRLVQITKKTAECALLALTYRISKEAWECDEGAAEELRAATQPAPEGGTDFNIITCQRCGASWQATSDGAQNMHCPTCSPVLAFATAILHGDAAHRAWLLEAAKAFVAGTPLPPPNGLGRAEAAEARLAELLASRPEGGEVERVARCSKCGQELSDIEYHDGHGACFNEDDCDDRVAALHRPQEEGE